MTQIDHYASCRESARSASLEQFTQRWPGHYLLVTIPGGDHDDWDMDFQTSVLSIDALRAATRDTVLPDKRAADDEAEAPPGTYLYEVRKHADNSWLEWIAVGRARNNDLILRHQSVSKLHARIHVEQAGGEKPAARSAFWLTDMRSTAGTTVNGAVIAPSRPYPLNPGDEIGLGQVTCEFLDSAALYRKLTTADW